MSHCHLSAVDVEALLEEVELPGGGLLGLGQGPDQVPGVPRPHHQHPRPGQRGPGGETPPAAYYLVDSAVSNTSTHQVTLPRPRSSSTFLLVAMLLLLVLVLELVSPPTVASSTQRGPSCVDIQTSGAAVPQSRYPFPGNCNKCIDKICF